eukprot:12430210-Karenia_brevis.AAC.1
MKLKITDAANDVDIKTEYQKLLSVKDENGTKGAVRVWCAYAQQTWKTGATYLFLTAEASCQRKNKGTGQVYNTRRNINIWWSATVMECADELEDMAIKE